MSFCIASTDDGVLTQLPLSCMITFNAKFAHTYRGHGGVKPTEVPV